MASSVLITKFEQLQKITPDVSRETFERLIAFEQLFLKWSKSFNLAASSTLNDFWIRHVLDSAQIVTIARQTGDWVDIGSGGGLPGIVLAIYMADQSDGVVHLVESNGKKAAFLRAALSETGSTGIVHNCRIEDAHQKVGQANVVTARALAPLSQLFALSEAWLTTGATALFHKGRDYEREITEARGGWGFDLVEHVSVVTDESIILEIRNLYRLGKPEDKPAQVPAQ